MRIELQWKEIEEKNCAIKWGGWLDVEESSDGGWPGVLLDVAWPTLEVEVEVSVDICLEVGSLKGDSSCRSP
jgi:hypothetical protein